jgi:hypothetical protein
VRDVLARIRLFDSFSRQFRLIKIGYLQAVHFSPQPNEL